MYERLDMGDHKDVVLRKQMPWIFIKLQNMIQFVINFLSRQRAIKMLA
jgi:hypothetical protein